MLPQLNAANAPPMSWKVPPVHEVGIVSFSPAQVKLEPEFM
jgi:hypothetical protein